jgi:hypothetical protein
MDLGKKDRIHANRMSFSRLDILADRCVYFIHSTLSLFNQTKWNYTFGSVLFV